MLLTTIWLILLSFYYNDFISSTNFLYTSVDTIIPIQLDGKKEDKEYIMNIIKKVGLEDQLKKFPNELSGGQQQRVE